MPKKVIKNKNVSQRMKNIINIKIGDKIVRRVRRKVKRTAPAPVPVEQQQPIQPSIQTYKFNLGNVTDEIKAINDRSNATFKETENYTKLLELQRKTDAEKLRESRVVSKNVERSKIMDQPEKDEPVVPEKDEPVVPEKDEPVVPEKDAPVVPEKEVETVNPVFIPFSEINKATQKERIKAINRKRKEIFERNNTQTPVAEEAIPETPVIEKPKRVLGKKVSEAEQADIIRVLGNSLKRVPTYAEFKAQIEITYIGYQKPSVSTFNKVINMLKRNKDQPIPSPAKEQSVTSSVSTRKSKK